MTATAAIGWPVWSSTAQAIDFKPGVTNPSSSAWPLARAAASSLRSWVSEAGTGVVAAAEHAAAGEERVDLLRRERGEHRQPGRGQVRGEADADVGHEAGPAGRALLDHVQHLAALQHREVGVVGGRGDEPGEHGLRDPAQRVLAQVGAAELVRADPEPVAALLGQVDDEALVDEHAQQVVRRAAREPEVARDRGRRQRRGMAGEQLEAAAARGRRRERSCVSDARRYRAPRVGAGRCGRHGEAARRERSGGAVSDLRQYRGEFLCAGGRPWSDAVMFRSPVTVGVGAPSLEDVVAVARDGAPVELSAEALAEVAHSRRVVEALANDVVPHYGVSTGFGALATLHIPHSKRLELQRGLIRSHAAGSGDEVEREVVRALMLLRLSTLATGRTGVRPVVATSYAAMLSAGITPVVHEYGSLGCSGDLAPLAHCALALMGEGPVRDATGALLDAGEALRGAGIEPVVLAEKEGLALINGTDGMLGMLVLAIADLRNLLVVADISAAMSVEGLLGTDRVFDADLHALRPQVGQGAAAANMRALLARSPIVASHRGPEDPRVQDAYSLRCAPQVAGAARDTVDPRDADRRARAGRRDRQPGRDAGRPRRVQRQLPRRPDRLRARLPGDRRRRCGIDGRAPHRPLPRRLPQPRPAAVPGRGSRASTAAT